MGLLSLIAALLAIPAGFAEDSTYVPLFTPRVAPAGTYRTFTTSRPLDKVLAALASDASLPAHDGSFESHLENAADAFGLSGGYNRWKLALLYGARRVAVARGPRLADGRVVEAWTLVSPYPDQRLERLNPGTLLIVLDLRSLPHPNRDVAVHGVE
jgi:hypothetical protein